MRSHIGRSYSVRGRTHGSRPGVEALEDRRLLANVYHEFPIDSQATSITLGPDGNLWMTAEQGVIERLTPSGQVSSFVRDPKGDHGKIVAGSDGNLWATTTVYQRGRNPASYVHRITTSGEITSFSLGDQRAGGIAAGADGTIWATRSGYSYERPICVGPWDENCLMDIVNVGPALDQISTNGAISTRRLDSGISAYDLVATSDGTLWLAGSNAHFISRINPEGQINQFYLPEGARGMNGLTAGPDGNPMFIETDSTPSGAPVSRIATIAPDGHITEISPPLTGDGPHSLAIGPDGNIWFLSTVVDPYTSERSERIERLTPQGNVARYALPSDRRTDGLTAGSDGNLWFTEDKNRVGQLVLADLVKANGLPVNVNGNGTVAGPLAAIDAAELDPKPGDFSALVDWGDGSAPSPGVIAQNAQGGLVVQGSHTYAGVGHYPVTVTIKDAGGASATATSTAVVSFTAAMDPTSDTGPSATDAVTADARPTFTGTAAPGQGVLLVVQRAGTPGLSVVGGMIAGPDGSWRIQSSTLDDGLYTVGVALVNTKWEVLSSAVLYLGSTGSLVVDTTPPRVVAASIDPTGGRLVVAFQDNLSGLDPAALVRPEAYRVSGRARHRGPAYRATAFSLFPPPATADQPRLVALTINDGRPIRPGRLTLQVDSGQITDQAGNPLEDQPLRHRPRGLGRPAGDFVARFSIRSPRLFHRARG